MDRSNDVEGEGVGQFFHTLNVVLGKFTGFFEDDWGFD